MSVHTPILPGLNDAAVPPAEVVAKRPAARPARVQQASGVVQQEQGLLTDSLLRQVDSVRWWLLGVAAVAYAIAFTGTWRPEPDSALYLSLARNIAEGKGYTLFGETNHLAYPGLPYLIAGTFKVFGVDNLFPAHVLMLGIGLATVWLAWTLVRVRFGRPTAVLVTFVLALSDTFFRYSYQMRNDMPFLLGAMGVLLGYEIACCRREFVEAPPRWMDRRWVGGVMLALGLAIATVMRPVVWALVPAVVLAVVWSVYRKQLKARYLLIPIAGVVVIAALMALDPRRKGWGGGSFGGQYETAVFQTLTDGKGIVRMFTQNLPDMLGSVTVEALFGLEFGPVTDQVVAVAAIVCGLALIRRHALWGLWVAAALGMMFVAQPEKRYYLSILPLLVLGAWQGIVWLNRKIPNRTVANWVCLGLVVCLAGTNFARSWNYAFQQRGIYMQGRAERGMDLPTLRKMGDSIREQVPESGLVIAPKKVARILAYFSDRQVIDARKEVTRAWYRGPGYVVMNNGVPDEFVSAAIQRIRLDVGPELAAAGGKSGREYTLHLVTFTPD